jgi:hypothetical protein
MSERLAVWGYIEENISEYEHALISNAMEELGLEEKEREKTALKALISHALDSLTTFGTYRGEEFLLAYSRLHNRRVRVYHRAGNVVEFPDDAVPGSVSIDLYYDPITLHYEAVQAERKEAKKQNSRKRVLIAQSAVEVVVKKKKKTDKAPTGFFGSWLNFIFGSSDKTINTEKRTFGKPHK